MYIYVPPVPRIVLVTIDLPSGLHPELALTLPMAILSDSLICSVESRANTSDLPTKRAPLGTFNPFFLRMFVAP